jgi:quinol monooxygenase YgiN
MYVIAARLRTRPGKADGYEALIRDVASACAREECFVQFNIHRGGDDGSEFFLYEIWTDKARYEALRKAPFFQAYLAARETFIESGGIRRSDWSLIQSVQPTAAQSQEDLS